MYGLYIHAEINYLCIFTILSVEEKISYIAFANVLRVSTSLIHLLKARPVSVLAVLFNKLMQKK